MGECLSRCARGRLDVRDLQFILLGTPADSQWQPARTAVLQAVAADPALAPGILSRYAQLNRLPALTVKESGAAAPPAFVAQASLQSDRGPVTGSIQRAGTRNGARLQATAALLARLADLPDPLSATAFDTEDWSEAESRSERPDAVPPAPAGPPRPRPGQ
ncbi:hypothetical protein NKH18_38890 [Streptomyces sp. M10(2022)]